MNTYIPHYPAVDFTGPWTDEEMFVALQGIHRFSAVLAKRMGVRSSEAFARVFGRMEFKASYSMRKGIDAYAYENNVVEFYPPNINEKLVVHELWHEFDMNIMKLIRPTTLLSKYGVIDEAGRLITGTYLGGYRRYNRKSAPANGYKTDYWKDRWQIHPKYRDGWQEPMEDGADIGLNLDYKTFVWNNAGKTLFLWAYYRQDAWIAVCVHREEEMTKGYYYKIINGEIVEAESVLDWAKWFESQKDFDAERFIARTDVGRYLVSTVFLGLNHNFTGVGDPVLFETMVFGGDTFEDEMCVRYTTLDDALEGHQNIVESIREKLENG